ncbi:VOC family protein [Streptomyces lydicus]|uniref:VOC family protein n=1 Tax=Streptomyces lydicus TaxID=47763 RepID=UPI0037A741F4
MGLSMRVIEIECADPIQLGRFWSAVLESPIGPGTDGVHIASQGNSEMSLYLVEKRSTGSSVNTARVWLNPMQGSLATEVERLTKLGASVLEKRVTNTSVGLAVVVMADPEGNEFCIESSDREVAEAVARFEDPDDTLDDLGTSGYSPGAGEGFAGFS